MRSLEIYVEYIRVVWRFLKRIEGDVRMFLRFLEGSLLNVFSSKQDLQDVDLAGTLLVAVANDKFIDYFEVFFHSLRKQNPWLICPLKVIYSETLSSLSNANRRRIESLWGNVSYHEVDEKRYQVFLDQTPKHMLPALFSLECLRFEKWNKVVFFDIDMLCLGDISELFRKTITIGICPSGRERTRKQILAGAYHLHVGMNTGVMVLGKRYRKKRIYDKLFSLPSGPVADQSILDHFFRWKPVYCFDHKYNYHAEFFWDKYGQEDDVRILHYAGAKPLTEPMLPRMKIWHGYFDKMRQNDAVCETIR